VLEKLIKYLEVVMIPWYTGLSRHFYSSKVSEIQDALKALNTKGS
jgi:hypothetical protein